jgi:large subunit ribosomal protein L6
VSRIGYLPIDVPEGVELKIENNVASVKGPKGELSTAISEEMQVKSENNQVFVERPSDSIKHRSLHGLTRTLLGNLITGVSQGFQKKLEIIGVGFKAEKRANGILLFLGFSHNIYFVPP